MMADKVEIRDESDLRKYYSQIPHLIDDADMSVYAYRLYGHIKRVVGQTGECNQSTTTLARHCHMAMGSIKKAKEELAALGFIKIVVKKGKHGEFDQHIITITDVWAENMAKYSTCSPHEQEHSPHEQDRSRSEQDRSPGELKNKDIKNKEVKNKEYQEGDADPHDLMARMVERLTGAPVRPTDEKAIKQMVEEGVIEDDIRAALQWRKDNGYNPVCGAAQLLNGVLRNKRDRVQGANAKPGKPKQAAPAPDEAPAGFQLWHAGDPL